MWDPLAWREEKLGEGGCTKAAGRPAPKWDALCLVWARDFGNVVWVKSERVWVCVCVFMCVKGLWETQTVMQIFDRWPFIPFFTSLFNISREMVRMCIFIIIYSCTKLVIKKKKNRGNVHVKNPIILSLLPCPPLPKFLFFCIFNQINYRNLQVNRKVFLE